MGKHKSQLQSHHLYLGAGGVAAVAALVVALTFGLSSAQTMTPAEMQAGCTSGGGTWQGESANPPCLMPGQTGGGAPAPQQVMCTNNTPAPSNDMNQCPKCPDGSFIPATGTCPTTTPSSGADTNTTITCGSGTHMAPMDNMHPTPWCAPDGQTGTQTNTTMPQCDWSTQYLNMSTQSCQPKSKCTNTADPDYNTSECQGVRNMGGNTTGNTGTGSCPSGQAWYPPTGGGMGYCSGSGTAGSMQKCFYTNATRNGQKLGFSVWCERDYFNCHQGTSAGESVSLDGVALGAPEQCESGWTGQNTQTTLPACAPGQWPSPSYQCRMEGTPAQTGEPCWNSNNPAFATQACTQERARVNDANTNLPNPNTQNMPVCGPNVFPTAQNPCRMEGNTNMPGQPWMPRPAADFSQPGQCPPDMQQCPDSFNPSNKICMPKKIFWDMKTQKNIPEGRTATCAEFQTQNQPMNGPNNFGGPKPFGFQGGFQNGFQGGFMPGNPSMMGQPGMPMTSVNPCQFNPNDPFCKAGFNFGDLSKQFQFDQDQVDFSQFQVGNSKQQIRDLKREAKDWARNAKDVRRQLKEVSRESNGFACPPVVEVDSIAGDLENAAATVNALTETSSQEDIQNAMAYREHINGKFDPETGTQVPGVQQTLWGGMDQETGEPIPGKMMSLNACRQISGMIQGACEVSKQVSREYADFKENGLENAEITKSFETAVAALNERCTNPLGVLQKAGVAFEELTKPWSPPETCGFTGFHGGPMPFNGGPGFPGPGGPGGGFQGGDFGGGPGGNQGGPFQGGDFQGSPFPSDLPPELMQKMIEKFQQMQGQQGQGGFQGSPFGASVLTAQNFDEGDEEFDGPQFGPPEMDEECMDPVHRHLGFDSLMRGLMEARFAADRQFENMSACNMFEMGQKRFKAEEKKIPLPPKYKDRIKAILFTEGPAACEEGDSDTVESLKGEMFALFNRKGGQSIIDVDQLVEDKLAEKLAKLGIGESDSKIAELQKKLDELQAKLSDAQKTVVALSERLSDMTAKLASMDLSDKGKQAVGAYTIMNKEVQNAVASSIGDLATKADQVKDLVSADVDKLVDATMNSLIQSPPSSAVLANIKESMTALTSYAQSGATKKEILEKARDELGTIAALNSADVQNKVAEGIVASADTSDLSQWYAGPALQAKNQGFIAADLKEIKPSEPETKCAALTRVARVLEKSGDLDIDENNKAPVAGAPEWCRPFIHALDEKGVDFVETLTDPNATADRLDIAVLMHQALGDKLPDPENAAEFITPDMKGLTPEQQAAVAEIRFNGIMDTTNGTDFSPFADFNRAQNALVTVKAYEAVIAGQ